MRLFNKLLGIKLPTLDPSIVDELQQWPPCRPLDDVPSRYEVEEAIRALANRKAVGPDGPPFEHLKVLADDRELNTLGNVYHRRCVEEGWRTATMEEMQRLNCSTKERSD